MGVRARRRRAHRPRARGRACGQGGCARPWGVRGAAPQRLPRQDYHAGGVGRGLGCAVVPARATLRRAAGARGARAGRGRGPARRAARARPLPRSEPPSAEARPLRDLGRRRSGRARAPAAHQRPPVPAAGTVRPDVPLAARRARRVAWRGAVRPRRGERVSQVRPPVGAFAVTSLLLAQDFPPMGGGIARLHGELARRYPRGELIVSTPQNPDAHEVDAQFGGAVDPLPVSRRFTKTLPGLLLWSRRATSLARQHRVRFVYCGNMKPAGYPARWVYERMHVPYGVFLYGADLLSEQHKYHSSKFKRRSARAILAGAAVYVAISNWTRDLALTVLGELGLDGHGQRLRVVHLGTDPEHFRPGVEATAMRVRLGLPNRAGEGGEGRWRG